MKFNVGDEVLLVFPNNLYVKNTLAGRRLIITHIFVLDNILCLRFEVTDYQAWTSDQFILKRAFSLENI